MDDTWARGLHAMTPQDLSNGLTACLAREESWPPSLPEFIRLCKPKDDKAPYHEMFVSLPKPKISKEEALAWVNKIRAELKV